MGDVVGIVRVLDGGAPAVKGVGGGGGVTASAGVWCRLTKAACTMQDDAPSRYTQKWRHKRPWWAPSPDWDERWRHN